MQSATSRPVLAIAVVLAIGTTACGGDSAGTGPDPVFTATYALQTIDGAALPAVPPLSGDQVISEILTLSGDEFALATVMRMVENGVPTDTYNLFHAGTYTTIGSTMTFHHTATGWEFDGVMSGNIITMTHEHGNFEDDSVWVYEKQ
jgi:hypothetical protein